MPLFLHEVSVNVHVEMKMDDGNVRIYWYNPHDIVAVPHPRHIRVEATLSLQILQVTWSSLSSYCHWACQVKSQFHTELDMFPFGNLHLMRYCNQKQIFVFNTDETICNTGVGVTLTVMLFLTSWCLQ